MFTPSTPRETPSPDLMIDFSVVFGFPFLFGVSVVDFSVCNYHEFLFKKKKKNGVVWLPHVDCALRPRGSLPWPTDSLWCLGSVLSAQVLGGCIAWAWQLRSVGALGSPVLR